MFISVHLSLTLLYSRILEMVSHTFMGGKNLESKTNTPTRRSVLRNNAAFRKQQRALLVADRGRREETGMSWRTPLPLLEKRLERGEDPRVPVCFARSNY